MLTIHGTRLIRQATCLGTGLLLAALSMQAQEATKLQVKQAEPKLYLKADAGAVYMQDLRFKVGDEQELQFNTGVRFDLAVGYNFSRSWAVELETGVIWNSADKYAGESLSAVGASFDIYQIPIMLNYIYRLPSNGPVEPFVGAGIGMVVGIINMNNGELPFDDADTTFGYQAMAGINYHLSKKVDLSLAYKFLGTTDHEWSEGHWYTQTKGTFTHAAMLGVSVKY